MLIYPCWDLSKAILVKGIPYLQNTLVAFPLPILYICIDKFNSVTNTIEHMILYNSVIFVGATLVYRPDSNSEGGCHANSARAKRGRYWLWQPPSELQEGRYTSVAPEQNHAIIIITT